MHYVLTGSTDEQIRVWDLSALDASEGAGSIDGKATKKILSTALSASEEYRNGRKPAGLVYEIEGHAHEVCKLALWSTKAMEGTDAAAIAASAAKDELYIVSAGLDCTIRKWRLRDILEKAKANSDGAQDASTSEEKITARAIKQGTEEAPKQSAMTAEEEAELAELMGED
jgi:WD40 repeat protein